MGEIRFIGDGHLGHPKVALLRGFESVDHWRAVFLRNVLRIARRDTLWYWTGDAFMGNWREEIRIVDQIPGTHVWILGNHDRAHPMHPNAYRYQAEALRHFAAVATMASIRHNGIQLLISHFPYDGDTDGRAEDRHTQWRLRDEGRPLICAHTHSTEKVSHSKAGTPQLNTSLDAWEFKPPTLHDLLVAGGLT